MGRYKTPTGSIVNVDDELAEKVGSTWERLDGNSAPVEKAPSTTKSK